MIDNPGPDGFVLVTPGATVRRPGFDTQLIVDIDFYRRSLSRVWSTEIPHLLIPVRPKALLPQH